MKKQLFFIILLGVVELLAGCRPEGKEPETGVSIGLARQRNPAMSADFAATGFARFLKIFILHLIINSLQ